MTVLIQRNVSEKAATVAEKATNTCFACSDDASKPK